MIKPASQETEDGQGTNAVEQGSTQAESQGAKKAERFESVEEMSDILSRSVRNAGPSHRPLRIEGSVRSNLLAAIASARRWRGKRIHQDTIVYWNRLLEYGRGRNNHGEPVSDLLAELASELDHAGPAPIK